ncbi:hypothetical protein K7I13_07580 [Brucepastera parasyntrophica]|uniref:CASTOR/POLLUX-related putative ion channel n=1 Tax=Brucepastera parasyntrophica TaxID=2880008 RepID=UPI00210DD7CB|nr:hypothetical protein [Brucepastera parasyntrophica]ULQ61103.1 hypothetical protein K7I13_07580 [Brucepastera parasyntrophica]
MFKRHFSGVNHILLLGWSFSTPIILEELAQTDLLKKKKIVLIAPKKDIPGNLPASAKKLGLKIISGDPENPDDLRLGMPDKASSILINLYGRPDNDEKAIIIAGQLNALISQNGDIPKITAVVEDTSAAQRITEKYNSRVNPLCIKILFPAIIAQISRQRCLSQVYDEILSFRGNEIYFYPAAQYEGATYSQILRAFENACTVGLLHRGQVTLNPPWQLLSKKMTRSLCLRHPLQE